MLTSPWFSLCAMVVARLPPPESSLKFDHISGVIPPFIYMELEWPIQGFPKNAGIAIPRIACFEHGTYRYMTYLYLFVLYIHICIYIHMYIYVCFLTNIYISPTLFFEPINNRFLANKALFVNQPKLGISCINQNLVDVLPNVDGEIPTILGYTSHDIQ